jgi:hypothetical protein
MGREVHARKLKGAIQSMAKDFEEEAAAFVETLSESMRERPAGAQIVWAFRQILAELTSVQAGSATMPGRNDARVETAYRAALVGLNASCRPAPVRQ